MLQKIRSLLYDGAKLNPLFNPVEVPSELPKPLVIDTTIDIANSTRLYHTHTDEIRALLAQTDAIVTDSEKLATVIRQFTKSLVAICPFGFTTAVDIDGELTIGILNWTEKQVFANKVNRNLLKGLKTPFLVGGSPLDWDFEGETIEDFELFAGRCDILVMPGADKLLPSMTLPLATMMAGSVVLTTNDYHALNAAAGVFVMPTTQVKPWRDMLRNLEGNLQRLQTLKQFNIKYAKRVNAESLATITKLNQRLLMAV